MTLTTLYRPLQDYLLSRLVPNVSGRSPVTTQEKTYREIIVVLLRARSLVPTDPRDDAMSMVGNTSSTLPYDPGSSLGAEQNVLD